MRFSKKLEEEKQDGGYEEDEEDVKVDEINLTNQLIGEV